MGHRIAVLLFAVAVAAAGQTITSVVPSSGPVAGGTSVRITGTRFTELSPADVLFGAARATNIVLVDDTTMTATTPAHLPGSVNVFVGDGPAGYTMMPAAFTFTGDPSDAFDRVLLPVFVGPVRGAYGSEFHTELHVNNASATRPVSLFGFAVLCPVLCPGPGVDNPYGIAAGDTYDGILPVLFTGSPGHLLYIPLPEAGDVAINLRVYDISRGTLNFGTEIPVVHDRDFRPDKLALTGVPVGTNFRNTLRIYAADQYGPQVRVTIGRAEPRVVDLRPGLNMFDPAYAEISDFPGAVFDPIPSGVTQRVLIEVIQPPILGAPPPLVPPRIWAFVTATNNQTQDITTITPH